MQNDLVERWVAWPGGKCPVRAGSTVKVEFRDGSRAVWKISQFKLGWKHLPDFMPEKDIVAFCVIRRCPSVRAPRVSPK